MFISALDIFKIGIGPSSSHTMGPMVAAKAFLNTLQNEINHSALDTANSLQIKCTLKGSLAFTGHGHATDRAVALGMHGYLPENLAQTNVQNLISELWETQSITLNNQISIGFYPPKDIIFDYKAPLPQHPNGMIFECFNNDYQLLLSETYFSIGGGFISTLAEIDKVEAPIKGQPASQFKYPFNSAASMLEMADEHNMSIAEMKQANELCETSVNELNDKLNNIWQAMNKCVENGLKTEGILPSGLQVKRRAKNLYQHLLDDDNPVSSNDWLCAYAMAVNEENAAGHMVVTAPTNGAAGVIPAALYYFVNHENGSPEDIKNFLLTAAAIGGLIKHKSSISGAEVGCQGEVGSASAMAAAGLCAVRGGTVMQIEQAAEMALEHHLGMTCDPVKGLVQVPCIERNGFGAIKAFTAASIALREDGEHIMPLNKCIAAMKKTGDEMSHKYKETSLGGLAVTWVEC